MVQMQGQSGVETRSYNSLLQVTAIIAPGVNMQYVYPASANNGQITQAVDGTSGETIGYAYDALKRLMNASSVGGAATWSEGYQYDGFGNLTGKTPGGTILPG